MRPTLLLLLFALACRDETDPVDVPEPDPAVEDTDLPEPADGPYVDPNCLDGEPRTEAVNPQVSLDALIATYDHPSVAYTFIPEALTLRYPFAASFVEVGVDAQVGDCIADGSSTSDRQDVITLLQRFPSVVKTCGRYHNLELSGALDYHFQLDADEARVCEGGGFARLIRRNRIKTDPFHALRPPCDGEPRDDCDAFADVYLSGSHDDLQQTEGGLGLEVLLDDLVMYVNALATSHAFADQFTQAVPARDAVYTMLWYLNRYLRLARELREPAYNGIISSACWQEALLITWGRAWHFLDLTADDPRLGVHDAALRTLATDPELLAEIQAIRDARGCASPADDTDTE